MNKTLIALATACCFTAPAQAGFYDDTTPSNSLSGAVSIDPYFTTNLNPDVGDVAGNNTSTVMPWVSIWGEGDGAFDFFSFYSPGGTIIADIDYTFGNRANRLGFDAQIAIWRDNGGSFTNLASNDDYNPITAGDGGSVHHYDSFIQLDNVAAGRYVVGVAQCCSYVNSTGFVNYDESPSSNIIADDRQYGLQISISPVPEPESYAMLLAGLGLMGAVARRRTRAA